MKPFLYNSLLAVALVLSRSANAGESLFREAANRRILQSSIEAATTNADDGRNVNWGSKTNGIEMSLRIEKTNLMLGEPVVSWVLLRNSSEQPISYQINRPQIELNVVISNADGARVNLTPAGERFFKAITLLPDGTVLSAGRLSVASVTLEPGMQHKCQLELDKLFELGKPGKYGVVAIRRIRIDGKNDSIAVMSNPVEFSINQ